MLHNKPSTTRVDCREFVHVSASFPGTKLPGIALNHLHVFIGEFYMAFTVSIIVLLLSLKQCNHWEQSVALFSIFVCHPSSGMIQQHSPFLLPLVEPKRRGEDEYIRKGPCVC